MNSLRSSIDTAFRSKSGSSLLLFLTISQVTYALLAPSSIPICVSIVVALWVGYFAGRHMQ